MQFNKTSLLERLLYTHNTDMVCGYPMARLLMMASQIN